MLTDLELAHAHVLLALTALLVAAHVMGHLATRLRQPRVIGEILGGVLLGPTVLQRLLPDAHTALFGSNWNSNVILSAIYKLGLILLLFCSGLEIRSSFSASEKRSAAWITVSGTLLPFGIALAAGSLVDLGRFQGGARDVPGAGLAFNLILAIAIAVTSIPVISRIFLDLDILDTPFARIVLSAAVIEDVVLYVVLSIALSLVASESGGAQTFGLMRDLGVHPGTTAALLWHAGVTIAFFAVALTLGRRVFSAASRVRGRLLVRASPGGFLMAFLLGTTLVAIYLGVNVMLGAFVAGIIAGSGAEAPDEARRAIRQFSSAFFIPIYFAMVGARLDLVGHLPVAFFAAFFAVACLVKTASVWAGARLSGLSGRGPLNLAMAMNARGGPGIVLASLAFDAGIVDERMHVMLVLLSVLTSMIAGAWLQREVRRGRALL